MKGQNIPEWSKLIFFYYYFCHLTLYCWSNQFHKDNVSFWWRLKRKKLNLYVCWISSVKFIHFPCIIFSWRKLYLKKLQKLFSVIKTTWDLKLKRILKKWLFKWWKNNNRWLFIGLIECNSKEYNAKKLKIAM